MIDELLTKEFLVIFDVWEQAIPYLSMMVTKAEMNLVVQMASRPLELQEISDLMDISHEKAENLINHAYTRCIVDKVIEDGNTKYKISDFYACLDHFVKYGNWHEIPTADRKKIDRRFLDEFISRHKQNIERKIENQGGENALPNDTIMLLSEVEEMIEASEIIVVQPCDCRKLGENCDRPLETCILLDDGAREAQDRGHGHRLTKDETIKLLRWANKKGLMHTADSAWRERGLYTICNCCACDCYPFRAGQELGTKDIWPKSRYVAEVNAADCTYCGACVKRCHFEAFKLGKETIQMNGESVELVKYFPEKCWGCGLCSSSCPQDAIKMMSLTK
jgi:ferredoxin